MLVRSKPFGEWLIVYYNPSEIQATTLLKLLRKRKCKKALIVKTEAQKIEILTPFAAAGDVVQLKMEKHKLASLKGMKLPTNWKVAGIQTNDGIISLQIPKNAPQGDTNVVLEFNNGTTNATISIVRQPRS